MVDNTQDVIDVDVNGYQEPQVVTDKGPYTLRVSGLEVRDVVAKGINRKVMDIQLRITDSGLVNPKGIRYSIWLPDASDTPEQRNASLGKVVRFKKAIGDDTPGGISKSAATGAEFQALLKVREDEEYGPSNEIARILA